MIGLRSLRSRLLLAAFLWTVGLFAAGVQVSTEIMLRHERLPQAPAQPGHLPCTAG